MSLPEYRNWSKYFALLNDLETPSTLKRCIVQHSPTKFIYAIEELLFNIQHHKVALNEETKRPLLKNYKVLAKFLANPKTSLKTKRELLKTSKGLSFLSHILPKLILEADQGIR